MSSPTGFPASRFQGVLVRRDRTFQGDCCTTIVAFRLKNYNFLERNYIDRQQVRLTCVKLFDLCRSRAATTLSGSIEPAGIRTLPCRRVAPLGFEPRRPEALVPKTSVSAVPP